MLAAGQQQASAEEQQEDSPEILQPQQPKLPDRKYAPEELLAAWQKHAEQVKAAGRQGEYIVIKETPDLPGGHLVQVRITNSVQKDYFDKARPAAQSYLRQALQNSQITVDCIMVKEEEGKRLYTGAEKFGYLLKKYPHLQELKERLGLEADF